MIGISARIALTLSLGILALFPSLSTAHETAKALSVKALEECDIGRRTTERHVRIGHFEKSQTLAEQAVALDEQSADAHYALFCTLGEQLRIDGEKLTSVFGLRRMIKELDRTLELNPDHIDAVSAKGTMLTRLPGMLGGDAQRGEQMLRQVIQRDQRAINARMVLAKIECGRGRHRDAMELATAALELARDEHRDDLIPEAEATVSSLKATETIRTKR